MRLPVEPVIRTACSGSRRHRAGEGLPSSRAHLPPIPLPLPRRVPQRLHIQDFSAFHGLRRDFSGSAPSCPLAGLASRGCRIRVMLRAGRSLPAKGFRHCASTPGVSPRRWQPATGPPGSYPDRTFTGWRTRACAWITSTTSPPITRGCTHAAGHTKLGLAVAVLSPAISVTTTKSTASTNFRSARRGNRIQASPISITNDRLRPHGAAFCTNLLGPGRYGND